LAQILFASQFHNFKSTDIITAFFFIICSTSRYLQQFLAATVPSLRFIGETRIDFRILFCVHPSLRFETTPFVAQVPKTRAMNQQPPGMNENRPSLVADQDESSDSSRLKCRGPQNGDDGKDDDGEVYSSDHLSDDDDMKPPAGPCVSSSDAMKEKPAHATSGEITTADTVIADTPVAAAAVAPVSSSGIVAAAVSQTPKDPRLIETPEPSDILFGRGKPFQSHPGNIRLHEIVNLQKDNYSRSRRFDKLAIADAIVHQIKTEGAPPGRFLRRVEGQDCWEVVPDELAREKVSHALRGKVKQANRGSRWDGASGMHNNNFAANRTDSSTMSHVSTAFEGSISASLAPASSAHSISASLAPASGAPNANPLSLMMAQPMIINALSLQQPQMAHSSSNLTRNLTADASTSDLLSSLGRDAAATLIQQLSRGGAGSAAAATSVANLQSIGNNSATGDDVVTNLMRYLGSDSYTNSMTNNFSRDGASNMIRNLAGEVARQQQQQPNNPNLISALLASNPNQGLGPMLSYNQVAGGNNLAAPSLLEATLASMGRSAPAGIFAVGNPNSNFEVARTLLLARELEITRTRETIDRLLRGNQQGGDYQPQEDPPDRR
jgi:hypothetical protein